MNKSFKLTLLALAVTSTLAPMLAAPAVKLLLIDFKDTNTVLVQLVVTFASFFILPSLVIGSYLAKKVSKKTLLCLGLILYVIGGVGPAFMNSINEILVMRAILGLGIGFITPIMNALVADYFEGEERAKMNGLTVGANGLGGAFFLIIGGAITALGWRGVFWTYSFGIVLLLLVLLFVPREKPVAASLQANKIVMKSRLPSSVYLIGLLTTGLMILYYVIPTNLASFVVDNDYGNSATAGYLTALSFIFVFLAGITGNKIRNILKRGTVPFVFLFLGLAFLLLNQANALWMVAISVAMVGFGFGLAYPILLSMVAGAAPNELRTLAVMLMTGFANIGQFISPLITNGIQALFHFNSIRSVFMIFMLVVAVCLLVAIIQAITKKKREFVTN